MSKLVSVVVPIYNQENYLDNSIPSILNQKYRELEIVLVNDGSIDSSPAIVKKYQEKDARVVVINKENGGLIDATISGINVVTGEYICFVDPDDRIGPDFISNFMKEIEKHDSLDFIAAGFYYEGKDSLIPYHLNEDRVYSNKELEYFKSNFLMNADTNAISNQFFISRWNKLYRSKIIKEIACLFSNCKNVSLGEDTIFTFLMLNHSLSGQTLKKPNTYYYNIGNQNSMMNSTGISGYYEKSKNAFNCFAKLLENNNLSSEQAYVLYYYLINALIKKAVPTRRILNNEMYKYLAKDKIYHNALLHIANSSGSKTSLIRNEFKILLLKLRLLYISKTIGKQIKNHLVNLLRDGMFLINKSLLVNPKNAYRLYRFHLDRRRAFQDVEFKLPLIEARILPMLEEFQGVATNLSECPIENNVFVFWWDGFDKAPEIVLRCLDSVKKYHKRHNIVEISKDTYRDYTDIDSMIIDDFEANKISIQTFSDILRFNLLKNNGGTWIDATIYFTREFDLQKNLTSKSFESVNFSGSEDFLNYKGTECSWSGFFISSRKNGVFVKAVDKIFQTYYLEYKTYSTYFFIDAVLIICKNRGLDAAVMSNVQTNEGNMFVLAKLLDFEFDENCMDKIDQIPQKLFWSYKEKNESLDTFYKKIISGKF